ncbi:hypothetical protein K474DRAFT_953622 [Panus rudis PR-1116 ss-1]|nr:hypothetical protein K474DRAFT_953622 [Panus rudis PR-1116 ss-1]
MVLSAAHMTTSRAGRELRRASREIAATGCGHGREPGRGIRSSAHHWARWSARSAGCEVQGTTAPTSSSTTGRGCGGCRSGRASCSALCTTKLAAVGTCVGDAAGSAGWWCRCRGTR